MALEHRTSSVQTWMEDEGLLLSLDVGYLVLLFMSFGLRPSG